MLIYIIIYLLATAGPKDRPNLHNFLREPMGHGYPWGIVGKKLDGKKIIFLIPRATPVASAGGNFTPW